MASGPDGALYVPDYGTGYFNGDANPPCTASSTSPAATPRWLQAKANTTSGTAPLAVTLLVRRQPRRGRRRPHASAWDFGDGATSTAASPSHT